MPTRLPALSPRAEPGVRRIGMLGTYPPRLCGLATFAVALEGEFVRAGHPVTVIAANTGRGRPNSTHLELCNGDSESVRATARALSSCDVAIIQHEYGIYGGEDGDEIIDVLRLTECPTIVVLHTVPLTPTAHQKSVLEAICDLVDRVVVMTATAGSRLADGYAVDGSNVSMIPHGAWSPSTEVDTDRWPGTNRLDLLTWGLLGPGKGIEHMIEAMSMLGDRASRVRYTVAGVTHPNVFARDGDAYRNLLIRRAWATGSSPTVRFDDSYRDLAGLMRLVTSASVVVLPYDSTDQVTSGVLVDAIAAGRPVIATRFPHAVELLSDGAGILVPHRDPAALAAAVRRLESDATVLHAMTVRAREIAPTLAWENIAAQYLALCDALEPTATSAGAAR